MGQVPLIPMILLLTALTVVSANAAYVIKSADHHVVASQFPG
ncbi:hypothetical protein [Rhodococcus sp. BH5]|nr:hypothetical protein [Rhodococcus sp. BH5]